MSDRDDDLLMADLLGEAPATPDSGFRYDVLAHVSLLARRRRAMSRALNQVALFSAIGLVFPILNVFGVTWENAAPIGLAAGLLALGLIAASISILGPRAALARSRAILTRA
ncbi:MAG: hypothetical protein DCF16_13330 [Alphaproteobacteria bacterium]|nr:MAG: hypothetical protein DCF16_13330 [Alphaproteobacteria bacterium]